MRRAIVTFVVLCGVGFFISSANAQMLAPYGTAGSRSGMGGFSNSKLDWQEVLEHTLREEKEGKELWSKLQAKEVTCADLTDERFGILGEYFMGQMAEGSHAAMNAMMIQIHGENGEEQIHIAMGKRLSGCDTSAAFPAAGSGLMPMMWGGMNVGFRPLGWFGWVFMILWWALIIVGIVALIKWLTNQSRSSYNREKSSLEILKERYAKGEIDKKEFEERKKGVM